MQYSEAQLHIDGTTTRYVATIHGLCTVCFSQQKLQAIEVANLEV